MIVDLLKNIARKCKRIILRIRFFLTVNWLKTIYFNFKMLPFEQARKLPFIFYGKIYFSSLKGKVKINVPIKMGLVCFGEDFEINKKAKGIAQLHLDGEAVFNGYMHIGKDVLFYVNDGAYCEFGNMACLGSNVRFVCMNKISLGNWTGIGYDSQLLDSNFHPMYNTLTNEEYPMHGVIQLGDHNAVSNRVTIQSGTITNNNFVIASNSLCNANYYNLGENVLIGGVPAKLIKNNFARNWEIEKESLMKFKIKW